MLETGGDLSSLALAAKVVEIVDMAQKGLNEYPPWQKHLKRVKDCALQYPKAIPGLWGVFCVDDWSLINKIE